LSFLAASALFSFKNHQSANERQPDSTPPISVNTATLANSHTCGVFFSIFANSQALLSIGGFPPILHIFAEARTVNSESPGRKERGQKRELRVDSRFAPTFARCFHFNFDRFLQIAADFSGFQSKVQ